MQQRKFSSIPSFLRIFILNQGWIFNLVARTARGRVFVVSPLEFGSGGASIARVFCS